MAKMIFLCRQEKVCFLTHFSPAFSVDISSIDILGAIFQMNCILNTSDFTVI